MRPWRLDRGGFPSFRVPPDYKRRCVGEGWVGFPFSTVNWGGLGAGGGGCSPIIFLSRDALSEGPINNQEKKRHRQGRKEKWMAAKEEWKNN